MLTQHISASAQPNASILPDAAQRLVFEWEFAPDPNPEDVNALRERLAFFNNLDPDGYVERKNAEAQTEAAEQNLLIQQQYDEAVDAQREQKKKLRSRSEVVAGTFSSAGFLGWAFVKSRKFIAANGSEIHETHESNKTVTESVDEKSKENDSDSRNFGNTVNTTLVGAGIGLSMVLGAALIPEIVPLGLLWAALSSRFHKAGEENHNEINGKVTETYHENTTSYWDSLKSFSLPVTGGAFGAACLSYYCLNWLQGLDDIQTIPPPVFVQANLFSKEAFTEWQLGKINTLQAALAVAPPVTSLL